ncbi:DUF1697 domain-containing protein [Arthrobacter cheniae]|uniref:DUF1697 domain-containing protein n=1 Tax=Arthrobacter cheniae TaxID=1258888 RepID=A0A3A5MAP4_9MICC|nr:DUF1697 domain-containing protein [Arthrobacter cheniae]RJT82051.1 DUF1697 domain-containing protein [Arthrobacter cheniae]
MGAPDQGNTVGLKQRYAIFLRGVNVGGITVRMADLRSVLGTLPLTDVATVLASGNVTCTSELDAAAIKDLVEDALRRRFQYQAWVIVVGRADLAAVAASVPTRPDGGDGTSVAPPDVHTYVTLFTGRDELTAFLDDANGIEEQPTVLAGRTAVAWFSPKGRSTDVPLAKLLARSRFAAVSTTRNINTIEKVLGLLG